MFEPLNIRPNTERDSSREKAARLAEREERERGVGLFGRRRAPEKFKVSAQVESPQVKSSSGVGGDTGVIGSVIGPAEGAGISARACQRTYGRREWKLRPSLCSALLGDGADKTPRDWARVCLVLSGLVG